MYDESRGTLLGTGEALPAGLTGGALPAAVFGDGSDGDLVVGSGQTLIFCDDPLLPCSGLSATASSGQSTLTLSSTGVFTSGMVGDEVLIIQMQGTDAGSYEFGTIASVSGRTLTLEDHLTHTYNVGGNSKAQVLRVPHYRNVTVQNGGVLTARAWDGSTGGIVVMRVQQRTDIQQGGTIDVRGKGYRGGALISVGPGNYQRQGEGHNGLGGYSPAENYGGGGGGQNETGHEHSNDRAGGGGGYGTPGGRGEASGGRGGSTYGEPTLSNSIFLGAGSGGAGGDWKSSQQDPSLPGAAGGGIMVIFAREMSVEGSLSAEGLPGLNGRYKAGSGGGAGGSIKIVGEVLGLGESNVLALGGAGGLERSSDPGGSGPDGGNGGVGRIRIEYQTIAPGWSTNPPASTQQVNFFAIEKVDANTVRYILPESITGGRTYRMQFGQRYNYPAAGDHIFHACLPKGRYSDATLDLILARVDGGSVSINLDLGDDGTIDWSYSGSPTIPFTTTTSSLATALHTFMASATPDPDGTVVIPIRVTLNTGGELFLTNLIATPASDVDVTLTTGDIGFGGSGWTANKRMTDHRDSPSVNPLASAAPTEGDLITVTATISNTGAADSGPLTVAFFATPPAGFGETYIGAAFVSNVPAGGTADASIPWNTLGFTGDVPVRVVVDLFDRVPETNDENNEATTSITILTRPDLHVPAIALSDPEPVAGQPVTVTVTISNVGETTAITQTVSLYQGNPDAGGTVVGAQRAAPLPGGNADTVAFTWTPTSPGPYRLFTD